LSGNGASASVVWNAALAALDSDGDGFSNGTELGDPDGDNTATPGAVVTNPGLASSFPQVVNNAPSLASIGAKNVEEGTALTFAVTATDQDNDDVTIAASSVPAGASFTNGNFTWTPGFDQSGSFTVSFRASDGTAETSATVNITVVNTNRVPVFDTIETQNVKEGQPLTFTVSATDPDGDAVTLALGAESLPRGPH
jgi:protocatechuate 3,4-dioxygenase beta subunit